MSVWTCRIRRVGLSAAIALLAMAWVACADPAASPPDDQGGEPAETREASVGADSPAPDASSEEAGSVSGTANGETASPTRLPGIDVSQFQGEIDWQSVQASGVVFGYARALEGETIHDSRFAANWQGMKEAGVVRGAYDFYVADDPPAAQLEVFTGLVTLEPGDLRPMVDIESASIGSAAPPDLVANFHSYLELMEAHYGVKPIIYTDPNFWNEHMDDSFGDYPLWVAEYGVDSPTLPNGWTNWVIWQHSESGSVPGIEGDVDLDLFNGALDELERYRLPPAGG